MLFAATPECKQLCSSLVTPLLPLWGSVPAPRLVPCITTTAETAVLLWVQTGPGTMAFLVPMCILPFLYQVTQYPSRSVLTPTQHTPCAAAILSCCRAYSAWGEPPAWMPAPAGGRRMAESSRAARWRLPEAAAFSPDAWLTLERSSPLLPGLLPSFPAWCQRTGC